MSQINIPEPVIQKGDLIGISVFSDNAAASAAFNQQMTGSLTAESGMTGAALSGVSGVSGQNMPGYLVDVQGNIRLHSIGAIKAEGLTKTELANSIQEKLTQYLKNPYCNIKFLNYKFTVLGEVAKQGVFSVPGEKISILEALGMAGDMTIYGLKDSIMVIREENGIRSFGILDVSKPDVLLSPYYYLHQNDIVLVKSNPKKPGVSEQTNARNLALVATFATIVTSITVLLNILLK
ncbi:MAG: polysaccharide biosynthesis/export family protein [Chitinophagaceae bacterium]|nr:polysaccharide biosynthesis/export family protein [Chitinophagaceae bacterium]